MCGENEKNIKRQIIDKDVSKDFDNKCRNIYIDPDDMSLFNVGPVMVIFWLIEEGWPIAYASDNVIHILGYTQEELTNQPFLFEDIIHPDDVKRVSDEVRSYIEESVVHYEQSYRVKKKDGTYIWVRDYNVIDLIEGEVKHIKGYLYDITNEKETELLLEEKNRRLVDIIEATQIGTWEWDLISGSINCNQRWAQMLGYSLDEMQPTTITTWENLIHKGDLVHVKKNIEQHILGLRPAYEFECRMRHKSGHWIWIHNHGKIMRWAVDGKPWILVGSQSDITETKNARAMLQHSEKLSAIGRLAGGIAHDINNQLMMISGYVDLMKEDAIHNRLNVNHLSEMESIVVRSSDIVKQLLSFSKQSKLNVTQVNLNILLQNIVEMMSHTLDKKISISYQSQVASSETILDQSLVESALINLCINGRDAMVDGGNLKIELENVEFQEPFQTYTGLIAEGSYYVISVSDNGKGINETTLSQIFEPFFTTKETGTGIGLSAVIGVMKQHNGGVNVKSVLGKGTTFKLYFPLQLDKSININKINDARENKHIDIKNSTKNILIVDDEPVLTQVLHQFLETKGCHVKSFTDPREVKDFYEEHYETIDIVILDMLMPYLSGTQVFQQLYDINPSVKVLYLSGYTEGIVIPEEYSINVIGFLEKPVQMNKIYEMLLKDE